MLLEFQERMIMVEEWWSFVEKVDCVWVTHFKYRSFHKYTRMAKGQERVKIKSMMLVKRDMLRYVQDVRAVRDRTRPLTPPCCTV